MHIVYATLTKLGGTGGDVIHISELTEELVRCGVRVTLVGSGKPQENLEGVEVIDAGRIISRGIFTRLFTFFHLVLRVFYQVLRLRRGADVLYTRDALLGCWFTTLRGLFRLPVVFEVNGLRAEESRMIFGSWAARLVCAIGKWAEKTTARKADAVICVTEGIRDILRDEYGVPAERMTVVPNGVNLNLFTPDVDPQEQQKLRQTLGLDTEDLVILYIGILMPWQDVSTLIKATGQLEPQEKNIVLLIVGDGKDRARLEAEAANLPAYIRVIFTGRVPYQQSPLYISLADICAMPLTEQRNARIGVSPIKLFAYLACGKSIIATAIRGFDFLEEMELGSIVPCADAIAYSEAIRDWLEHPQRIKDTESSARRYAEENCGWDRTARQVYAVCRDLAASQKETAEKDREF